MIDTTTNVKFQICFWIILLLCLGKCFQVYFEVDKIGEELVEDPEKKLPCLLGTINDLFTTLEASIGHLHANRQVCMNITIPFA